MIETLGIATIRVFLIFLPMVQETPIDKEINNDFLTELMKLKSDVPYFNDGHRKYYMAASRIAEKYGKQSIKYLSERACKIGDGFAGRMLSIMALAQLSGEKEAEEELIRLCVSPSDGTVRQSTKVALSYCEGRNIRRIITSIISHNEDWRLKTNYIGLLIAAGDGHTDTIINDITRTNKNTYLRDEIARWRPVLLYRMSIEDENVRKDWEAWAISYWRFCIIEEGGVDAILGEMGAAKRILKEMPNIPEEFLIVKLKAGDCVSALALGVKKCEKAIELLKKDAGEQTHLGKAARWSLAMIGTKESIEILEGSIRPNAEVVNMDLAERLADYGNEKSRQLLEMLSASEGNYNEHEREAFKRAAKRIGLRNTGK